MTAITPDHPAGSDLLDVARRALLDEIAPKLAGRDRYVVLMVANAIGVVIRELAEADATAEAWRRALASIPSVEDDPLKALVAAIREGRHDANCDLHEALSATTEVAAGIWKPSPAPKPSTDGSTATAVAA